ncbi:DUF3450 domain-containing protein [Paenibacillus methanolicus]|uniref:Uncharacterized protein n=1 Tax=Paenibacillus methanolicus TaxID=582686 RepID=A0A5S5C8L2_9BACL|nr:DUF3450 domain-containing protein [Paenibacillus methanolicus]TYP74822.1 hypothetical protein BCM02_105369 [Paenibacillus methanolicus]
MKFMWCWRCEQDMPMLDEEEYARMNALYGECMRATEEFRLKHGLPAQMTSMNERFRPVVEAYEQLTGYSNVHHNAIMHHRISMYGVRCNCCGKPLRTPTANLCAACGTTQSM